MSQLATSTQHTPPSRYVGLSGADGPRGGREGPIYRLPGRRTRDPTTFRRLSTRFIGQSAPQEGAERVSARSVGDTAPGSDEEQKLPARQSQDQRSPSHHAWSSSSFGPRAKTSIRFGPQLHAVGSLVSSPPSDSQPDQPSGS